MSDWLKSRKKNHGRRADVVLFHSFEGGGKTSLATHFREPTFAMSSAETGLLTLMSKKLVKPCDYFPEFQEWNHIREATQEMIGTVDRPKTFVVDTVNGIEDLLVDHICLTKYGGEMTKKGFLAYKEGPLACVPLFREWITDLEALRNKGTTIVLLAHSKTSPFKNPTGADYGRYVPDLDELIWAPLKKFVDLACFIDFATEVANVDKSNRGVGVGGRNRTYHFERSAGIDAKHRHGLPPFMAGKGNAKEDFAEFVRLVKLGEANAKAGLAPGTDPEAPDTDDAAVDPETAAK